MTVYSGGFVKGYLKVKSKIESKIDSLKSKIDFCKSFSCVSLNFTTLTESKLTVK